MEKVEIKEMRNGYVILYNGKFLYKEENPTFWYITNEVSQIYTEEKYAKNDVKSLKRYITERYNGNWDTWEKEQLNRN